MVKGKFAKRRDGLLLGRIFFDKDKIFIHYLFKKKVYLMSDIDYLKYTYYYFFRGGAANYFEIAFNDNTEIFVFEKANANSADETFYIRQADKIIFTRYYYGRPQLKENIIQTAYIRMNNSDNVQILQTGAMGERNEIIKVRNINAVDY